MLLKITDESHTGDILNTIQLNIKDEIVRIKDIIAARVEAEVENYNAKIPEYFNGLIRPTDSEKTLNGFKLKKGRKIDAEKQVYIAYQAYENNGFIILIDDVQAESLEQEVLLEKTSAISFLKLTPLIGG
ncbi:hypothetical protein [uncultured Christiangramia sp.]|uniref:hypothetical protein n=1 Tax=uncultured Christiangramia sp. TaxID=503836 RepID=UPI00261F94A5|nr:hypothetical protein [uncultured Christiangramia sp.]